MQMGHKSHRSPTLGRRPSTITTTATTRGARTFATVTAWSTTVRTTATRSAPLSVSAKRDMSMINQQIRARRAVVVINILVPAHIKPEAAARLVVENIRLVLALADIGGVLVVVLVDVLHLMCGMEVVVSAAAPINIAALAGIMLSEVPVWLAMANMNNVSVKMDMSGVMEFVI